MNERYRTKTGRVLTDEEIQALADEAEAGYDVSQLDAKRETLTEYRIESRHPRRQPKWVYIAATYCTPTLDLREARARLARLYEHESLGWEHRIVSRTVTVARVSTPWEPVVQDSEAPPDT